MTALAALCRENTELLKQAVHVLHSIPGEIYARGIGAHFRHIFNHYDALLLAKDGVVDYETRERGGALEREPARALLKAEELIGRLSLFSATGASLKIERIMRAADNELRSVGYNSTPERELDFISQHTTHHFAVIALMLAKEDIGVPAGFGMSPSTLRYAAGV